jgi:hypothetical protein
LNFFERRKDNIMPQGVGTYGSKRGRPPKKKVVKKKGGSKILGSISPLYGMISGEGAFGKLASAGFSPAGMLAKQQKKKKQMRAQEPVPMKHGGTCGGMGKAVRGGKFSRNG